MQKVIQIDLKQNKKETKKTEEFKVAETKYKSAIPQNKTKKKENKMTSRRSACFQEILIEDYYSRSNYHQDQNNWTQLYELMDVVKYHRPITFHRIYLVFLW